MKTEFSDLLVEPAHDRKGIEFSTANDIYDLSVDEAKELLGKLQKAIIHAELNDPEAPAPLNISGHGYKDGESFAQCGRMEPDRDHHWSGGMAGYELSRENLQEIIDWCKSCQKYINKQLGKRKDKGIA